MSMSITLQARQVQYAIASFLANLPQVLSFLSLFMFRWGEMWRGTGEYIHHLLKNKCGANLQDYIESKFTVQVAAIHQSGVYRAEDMRHSKESQLSITIKRSGMARSVCSNKKHLDECQKAKRIVFFLDIIVSANLFWRQEPLHFLKINACCISLYTVYFLVYKYKRLASNAN